MFKTSIFAALMIATVIAQSDLYSECRKCIDDGGRHCLTSSGGMSFYDSGTCCAKDSTSYFCTRSNAQKAFNFCAESSKIKNE